MVPQRVNRKGDGLVPLSVSLHRACNVIMVTVGGGCMCARICHGISGGGRVRPVFRALIPSIKTQRFYSECH